MRILDTPIHGLKVIEFQPIRDDRGYFVRTFCAETFERHGLRPFIAQANVSSSARQGTMRGLHFQVPPVAETKVIRCTRGAIVDVAIDLRPESPTFLQHYAVELSAENLRALYVPKRFANGYLTLTDSAEAAYHVDAFYTPGSERGLCFNDERLRISWPIEATVVSDKDQQWPLLDEARIATIRDEMSA